MADLIEREWLLKRMQFAPDADVVRMAPAVKAEPVWISVQDRLPEEAGNVIMLISGIPAQAFYLSNGKFQSWNRYLHEAGNEVTHWMPLPEPPKEDSHE